MFSIISGAASAPPAFQHVGHVPAEVQGRQAGDVLDGVVPSLLPGVGVLGGPGGRAGGGSSPGGSGPPSQGGSVTTSSGGDGSVPFLSSQNASRCTVGFGDVVNR